MWNKTARMLLAAVFAAGLLVPATQASAECNRGKLRKAEINYRNAVRRHGSRSKQAEHWRAEVAEERAKCR